MKPKPFWPLNHLTVPVVIFFSKARTSACRATIARLTSTSSMSLEKEPAGAFNKAQRLIEWIQYTPLSRYCKDGRRFVSARQLWCSDREPSSESIDLQARLYRLTGLLESGHVDTIKLHRCDKQIGSSEPVTNIAALTMCARPATARRDHYPQKSQWKLLRNWLPCRTCRIRSPKRGGSMHVLVRDNNVEQALRVLKKKMQREGVFREMKRRRSYEKPSEKKTREKSEAIRRARKLARKQAIKEGLLPAPPKKKPFERKPPLPEVKARVPTT